MNETITEPYAEATPLFTCDGIGSEAKKKLFHEIITRAMHAREARLREALTAQLENSSYYGMPDTQVEHYAKNGSTITRLSATAELNARAALNQQNEAEKK